MLLRLFHEFNASAHAFEGVAPNPSRIASLLGAEQVQVLAQTTPTLEERYHGPALKGLRLSYSRALHSAAFAHKLTTLGGKPKGEEYAAAGLLQNLGEMALWAKRPGTMNLLWGSFQRPEELDFKSRRRFGVAPSELGEELAKRWQLPVQVILAQRMHHSFDPNAQLPLLAASLAWAGLNDWQSEETTQLMQLAADLTHLDPDMVRDQIHRVAAEIARTAYAMGLPHGADRLLLLPLPLPEAGSISPPAAPVPTARTEAVKSAGQETSEPVDRAPNSVRSETTMIVPPPLSPQKTHVGNAESKTSTAPPSRLQQQLEEIMQEMRDQLGLERVMFAMLTENLDKVRARFVLEGTRSDLDSFTVSVKKRNLFRILMRKPHALWIQSSNHDKYLPFIPEQAGALVHKDGFFMASILTDQRPIGLVYADGGDTPLDRPRFEGFKTQCHRIAKLFDGGKGI